MNTIIEVTPSGQTKHEMPEMIYDAIKRALDMRLVRSVKSAIAILPEELRKQITSTAIPKPPPEPPKPSFVFYDELATPEELKRAHEYYEKQMAEFNKP